MPVRDQGDTPLVNYTFLGETIMEARYKSFTPMVTITTMCAEEIVMGRLDLQNGKVYHLLMDLVGIKLSMTKKARAVLMGPKGTEGLLSVAVVVNNRTQAWITNFILKFKRFNIPVRVFYSRAAALRWLGGQQTKWN